MSATRTAPVRPPKPAPAAGAPAPLRLLTFSTLYPSPARPHHGVFVENRLRHLLAGGEARAEVLAPVPWFPGRGRSVPACETRHGITVHHPRFLAPPGLGMYTAPLAVLAAARRVLRRLWAEGARFDAIDAHYLYPDGVAAIRLGREFGLPVVITARGSDTSQLPRYALPRRLIQEAMREAAALIAVSEGLKGGLVELGAPPEKVTVLRNGVDLHAFRPAVARIPSAMPTLLTIGHLIPRKGHDLVIGALPALPGHQLVVVGEGPERAALEGLARRLGVADRVRFAGLQAHEDLPRFYNAADVMILASSREGWANVLLEAMACGTPVIASPAWGSREAVAAPEAGMVLDETTPDTIATAVRALLAAPPSRAATRAYAERFGWDATTAGQIALFRRVLA
ncbi:glycosyltransferase family 4 protein [Roseococcus pinisoli]|uniref:Glycosyltransferase family 4 protein n=1 Tax=Roseococcus pinisoli TaxID=2835040 RepID=A0ABS5QEA3_9PROT|nr:glycosyltransferase family 4 protein [Roseococcus pinisoli]MBS7812035.1 glycosyltransferase family 4 protein [Roseococcus pinisoli]